MNPFGLGGKERTKDKRDLQLSHYGEVVVIPPTFMQDLSSLPVKMQGNYGTCGGHAGSVIDSFLYSTDLSPKFLWKEIIKIQGNKGDIGTDMRTIFQALKNYGDCTETYLPNTIDATFDEYSDPSVLTNDQIIDGQTRKIGNYAFEAPQSWDQIKQLIYQNKGLLALVRSGSGWWTPNWTDILPIQLGNPVGAHFVFLHSYDEQYIYFRNSWSSAWGKDGDGYFDQSYLPNIIELGSTLKLSAPFVFLNNLYFGMKSNDVLELQKRLNMTQQTGFFGALTLLAVLAFQRANKISPTGFVGPLTRAVLNK